VTIAAIHASIPASSSASGAKGEIGDLTALGATQPLPKA